LSATVVLLFTWLLSLQRYSWDEWQAFIDWLALSGINQVLAMTGQEEIQYKVFQHFGLNDTTIRTWFNGPAFCTGFFVRVFFLTTH
jgi:hypothetical protein